MLAGIVIQTREDVDDRRTTIKVRCAGLQINTTETAVVDKQANKGEHGHHHGHAH